MNQYERAHAGRDVALLAARHLVYEHARADNRERWSGNTRNWHPINVVELNPEHAVASVAKGIAA